LAQLYAICGLLLFYASALERVVLVKLQSVEEGKSNQEGSVVPNDQNAFLIPCLIALVKLQMRMKRR
jgi:hypothetical protein